MLAGRPRARRSGRLDPLRAGVTLFTFTDELGSFRLDPSPAGTFFVHVEVLDPVLSHSSNESSLLEL